MVEQLGSPPPEWQSPIGLPSIGGGLQQGVFGDDAQLSVRFVMFPEILEKESFEKGYKVIVHKEYVRIQRLGDRTTIYFQPARQRDRLRFPQQYQAFKTGKTERFGIPLEAWDFPLSESELLTFKLLGIEYVHQIAAMDEGQMLSLGGNGGAIIARAKITTNEVSSKEAAAGLQAKFDSIEKELATQRDQNAQLMKLLTAKAEERIKGELAVESVVARALEASAEVSDLGKRGRGRPKKQ